MYKLILVAYDGSEDSNVALRQGSELARLCNANLHLVGIVATSTFVASPVAEGYAGVDIWTVERKTLESALNAARRKHSDEGLVTEASLREGNPAHEIAACAQEIGADLVIVGHSDKGVLSRWFEGSVGQGLLRELPCNMLVATG